MVHMAGRFGDDARQWGSLCRKLAREHRRAAVQFSDDELREYLEWVSEQWELASLVDGSPLQGFRQLVKQVTSHRETMMRLRAVRHPRRSAKVIELRKPD